jgi:hypothetical protein
MNATRTVLGLILLVFTGCSNGSAPSTPGSDDAGDTSGEGGTTPGSDGASSASGEGGPVGPCAVLAEPLEPATPGATGAVVGPVVVCENENECGTATAANQKGQACCCPGGTGYSCVPGVTESANASNGQPNPSAGCGYCKPASGAYAATLGGPVCGSNANGNTAFACPIGSTCSLSSEYDVPVNVAIPYACCPTGETCPAQLCK